jgi:hypothetical protein
MADPRLKICSHPTCVNLFAGSQKIAIKKRHVMASSFARQPGGVGQSVVRRDEEHHEQVFSRACKGHVVEGFRAQDLLDRVCKCRGACKGGGWVIDRKRRTGYRWRIKENHGHVKGYVPACTYSSC